MRVCSEEVRVPVGDAVLAGTLLAPAGDGPHPCLLLISGSGANDRDELVCGHTPFRVIAEYFASLGYAVLRCDDRGVGGSTGDASKQDFERSVEDVVATSRWLAGHPAVDAERMALLGHSEGGLLAAAAGPQTVAWKVIMLAGPAVAIDGLLHAQARTLSVEGGATPAQIDHERRMNERVFALARSHRGQTDVVAEIEDVIRASLGSWPDLPDIDEATINDNAEVMASIVTAPAYRSLLRQDPRVILSRLDQPLLAVYGGKDVQVPGATNAEAFKRITSGRLRATCQLFPDHNHLFQLAVTGSISEYESLPPGPDLVVLREISDWLTAAEPGAAVDWRGV